MAPAPAFLAACFLCLLSASAFAQDERSASLLVTVLDETRAVLDGATVTVKRIDGGSSVEAIEPAATTTRGQARFQQLPPGRYSVTVESPGFQSRVLSDVRVRAGDNREVVVLRLEPLQSSVTVERDRQQAASDRDVTFGHVLTREQMEALSDDPDELRRQLLDFGGPNAKIFVDSFEGRELPPKALIKSIRVTRDRFAPEMHTAGEFRIEVLTQPGVGPLRTSVRTGFYDSAMDGRNPLVGRRGPAQSWTYGLGLNGTLIRDRASFNLNINAQDSYSTPVQVAATSAGQIRGNVPLRSPNDNVSVSAGLDYALTRDQLFRVTFNGATLTRSNIGVGMYDLIERAYSSDDSSFGVFIQQSGPVGRRFLLNTRVSITGNDSVAQSAVEEPTIVVNDSFTSGGAQRRGGSHTRNVWLNSDLDYVRGIHAFRAGVEVQHGRFRSDAHTNYLGTYVFESLAAFEAGRPRSYSRRIGDPRIGYRNVQAGIYLQDDIKVRKGLTVTGGVRYEAQTHVDDVMNFAPRAGFTWAPFSSGKTTLRGSWGVFYDWLPTGTYAQTLQVDGFRQRELNIINPSYPDPGGDGTMRPTNRYLLPDDLQMAYSQRFSAGASQAFSRRFTGNVLYTYTYRYALLAGRNLNAPVNRVRPDPTFANVVRATPDATGMAHAVTGNVNINLGPSSPARGGAVTTGPRFSWRRGLSIAGYYNWGRTYDNTDGPFALPASSDLDDDWGPSMLDRRHNASFTLTSGALRNLTSRLTLGGTSAPPLTIRTGRDDNGDLVYNDRPAGVGRNSARTRGTVNSVATLTYNVNVGVKPATSSGSQPAPRYRLALSLNIQNLLNKPVYSGFSGIMTSPFFLKPTSASGVRRLTLNTTVSF